MFDSRTLAVLAPSSPSVTLSWPHNVRVPRRVQRWKEGRKGREEEESGVLVVRNPRVSARRKQRKEPRMGGKHTWKGSVESSMANNDLRLHRSRICYSAVLAHDHRPISLFLSLALSPFTLSLSLEHCPGPTAEPRTLATSLSRCQIPTEHAHTKNKKGGKTK